MSTYILMKILESSPHRYDKSIYLLTLGKINQTYDNLAAHIKKGQKVLDIGCGTGAFMLRAAAKGAFIKGIDTNPQMLQLAKTKLKENKSHHKVELCEMGVAELSEETAEGYDVVVSILCFSELSENELVYSLKEIHRILKTGGNLLIADEVRSCKIWKKIINWVLKFPLVLITYLLTQTTTHALQDLPDKIIQAGFLIQSVNFNTLENFVELIAMKQG